MWDKTKYKGVARRSEKEIRVREGVFRTYQIDYYWDGLRRRDTVRARSDKEAFDIRERKRLGHLPPGTGRKKRIRFSSLADMYIEDSQKKRLNKHTIRDRIWRTNNLRKWYENSYIASISKADIEEFKEWRAREGWMHPRYQRESKATKPKTVNKDLSMMKQIMRWARDKKLITPEQFHEIESVDKLPLDEIGRIRVLSVDERKRMLDACKAYAAEKPDSYGQLFHVVFTALCTGIRRSGLLTLKRHQIDVDGRWIRGVRDKGPWVRNVPISKKLEPVLRECLVEPDRAGDGRLFQIGIDGKRDIQWPWKLVRERAQLEDFHWHDLRHCFATDFLEGGGDIYALSKILGHASVNQTDVYVNHSEEFIRKSIDAIDNGQKRKSHR